MVGDFEQALRATFADYAELEARGRARLGASKPLVARYVARRLGDEENSEGWDTVRRLGEEIRRAVAT